MNKCFSQIRKLCIFLILWQVSLMSFAYDFEGDGIYYNITSSSEVEVTYRSNPSYTNEYSGSVIIPEFVIYGGSTYNVTNVDNQAFDGRTLLQTISIPNSVKSIGNFAFRGCTGLTSVTIGENLTSIGNDAFINCIKVRLLELVV